jgi:hypothetical protein
MGIVEVPVLGVVGLVLLTVVLASLGYWVILRRGGVGAKGERLRFPGGSWSHVGIWGRFSSNVPSMTGER